MMVLNTKPMKQRKIEFCCRTRNCVHTIAHSIDLSKVKIEPLFAGVLWILKHFAKSDFQCGENRIL